MIRIILMIGCGILIPYIGRWLYGPLIEVNFKELEKSELISQAFLYVFILLTGYNYSCSIIVEGLQL